MGDCGRGRGRPVGAAYLSPAESFEAGALPSCSEEATGGAHEDYGQCGHILHAVDALHFHIQVFERFYRFIYTSTCTNPSTYKYK